MLYQHLTIKVQNTIDSDANDPAKIYVIRFVVRCDSSYGSGQDGPAEERRLLAFTLDA
jgi:hypothetical protein